MKSSKKHSEELCKNSFDRFLKNLLPYSSISWEDVPQKCEPPDYYLCIDDNRYAVEVTILMKKVNVGKKHKPLPHRRISENLQCFIKNDIESIARDNNYLCGTYWVSFSEPIKNFPNNKRKIQSSLLSYIRKTQNLNNAPCQVVYKTGRQDCEIEKTGDRDDKVCIGISLTTSKWDGEINSEVYQLLDESIGKKVYKLRNISCPKILLLHDQYLFACSQKYKSFILSISSRFSFHTVFLVENKSKSLLLYSQDPKWESKL